MTIYVYAYLRKDGTPYYIGKGVGRRAVRKHTIQIPEDQTRIVVCEQNLTELGALALERRLISWYGRIDDKSGILRNLTPGGDGIEMTPSIRSKISQAHLGVPKPNVSKANKQRIGKSTSLLGRSKPDDHKKNISLALTGLQRSNEHCKNISMAKKGKKLPKSVCRIHDRKEMSLQHYGYWLKRLNLIKQ